MTRLEARNAPIPELFVSPESAAALERGLGDYPSWDLTARQLCDLELLLNGEFAPLGGFMTRADHNSVLGRMRLAGDQLWPMPITLDVSAAFAERVEPRQDVALRDP